MSELINVSLADSRHRGPKRVQDPGSRSTTIAIAMLAGLVVSVSVGAFEQAIFETLNVRLIKTELRRMYIPPGEFTDPVMRALVKDPNEPNIEPTWANALKAAWKSKGYQRLPNTWWVWSCGAILWGMHSVLRVALRSQRPVRDIAAGTLVVCLVLLLPAFAETALKTVSIKTYNVRPAGVDNR